MKLLLQLDLQHIRACNFQHFHLSKPFEIGQDYPRQNFNSIENQAKRKWFLSHFVPNAQSFIRREWHSFMETHKVNDPFFNWWSILIWWAVLILTSWTIYFDELRWYRNDLSWVVNLYNSVDHNCLWWAYRNRQRNQRILSMQRYWSTCQNHYWYMPIKGNYHSTQ